MKGSSFSLFISVLDQSSGYCYTELPSRVFYRTCAVTAERIISLCRLEISR